MQPIDKNFTPVEYDPQYILMVNQLKKYFPIKGGMVGKTVGQVKAVDGVTFNLKRGTTMGLVGESGCGKTTTGRTILRLSGEKTGGQVLFNGKEVYDLSAKEMRKMRTKMQIIFQDPFSSLSPRLPVGEIIGEAVREHNLVPKAELNDYIDQVMDNCGLQPFHKDRYPHEPDCSATPRRAQSSARPPRRPPLRQSLRDSRPSKASKRRSRRCRLRS